MDFFTASRRFRGILNLLKATLTLPRAKAEKWTAYATVLKLDQAKDSGYVSMLRFLSKAMFIPGVFCRQLRGISSGTPPQPTEVCPPSEERKMNQMPLR
jgi:hypothetical protein